VRKIKAGKVLAVKIPSKPLSDRIHNYPRKAIIKDDIKSRDII